MFRTGQFTTLQLVNLTDHISTNILDICTHGSSLSCHKESLRPCVARWANPQDDYYEPVNTNDQNH